MRRVFGMIAPVVVAAGALTACGDSGGADADGDGVITQEEMEAEVASAGGDIRPQAGQYSVTMEVIRVDIPGAPPEMANMMQQMMGNTFEYCLTEEEANRGFEEALTEGQDESCEINKFSINGGDIDMAMTCEPEAGQQMAMTMTGSVTPTSSNMEMSMQGNIEGLGEADIQMKMAQERTGDCT